MLELVELLLLIELDWVFWLDLLFAMVIFTSFATLVFTNKGKPMRQKTDFMQEEYLIKYFWISLALVQAI